MKNFILILFFTIAHINIWAQPAPCMEERLDIVENIQNIDFANTEIFAKSIQLRYRWDDIIVNNHIDTTKLVLGSSSYKYCSNIVYKSKLHNRFYYSQYGINEILIIQNGEQKMYLVFPPALSKIEYNYFFKTIEDSIGKLNIQNGKMVYYYPYRYISNIEFREGVFFIKDYEEKFKINSFEKNDILEFFPDNNPYYIDRNPREYWNEKIYFISLFDKENRPEYIKAFYGNFSENQAIEIIVKNYPPIIENILESSTYIINNTEYRTQHQKNLYEIWYNLLRRNIIDKEVLLQEKYDYCKSSIDKIYKEYKEFQKTEFISILKEDFDLTVKYYKYFTDENNDLKPFKEFILKNEMKFSKEKLSNFIDGIKRNH